MVIAASWHGWFKHVPTSLLSLVNVIACGENLAEMNSCLAEVSLFYELLLVLVLFFNLFFIFTSSV